MKPRYSYDLEFLEDGTTIELISIGIVGIDNGREYYAVNAQMPVNRIKEHSWLMKNVWPSLPVITRHASGDTGTPYEWIDHAHPDVKSLDEIAEDVKKFLLADGPCELWGFYPSYDHVRLAQLFGRMIDLPSGIPMFTIDLAQIAYLAKTELPYQSEGLHNALADARFNIVRFQHLRSIGAVDGPVRCRHCLLAVRVGDPHDCRPVVTA